MPLTNTQHDQIMRGYQDRQLKRQQLIDTRREEIACKDSKDYRTGCTDRIFKRQTGQTAVVAMPLP